VAACGSQKKAGGISSAARTLQIHQKAAAVAVAAVAAVCWTMNEFSPPLCSGNDSQIQTQEFVLPLDVKVHEPVFTVKDFAHLCEFNVARRQGH
jgi:hypothetical protein